MALSTPNSLTVRKKQPLLNKATLQSPSSEGEAAISTPKPVSKSHRIWSSDVVVTRSKNLFLDRKWRFSDVKKLVFFIILHGLALVAIFNFEWSAFWVAFGLYVLTGGFGITLSYHRNLTHRSYTFPKLLEYLFAYFGVLAIQGDPITWVSAHRQHHKFVDTERDPHSPTEGFWFSHISWVMDTGYIVEKRGAQNNVDDLKKQSFYRFLKSTYMLHPFALGLLLYAWGGFSYVAWGMGLRTVFGFHCTFMLNSVGHVWGNRVWNTGDLSTNNWWLALLTFGEGWHNNHHAFEFSARHGLEWWQVDTTWYTIRLLQVIGLVKDVKLPSESHKIRMAIKIQEVKD